LVLLALGLGACQPVDDWVTPAPETPASATEAGPEPAASELSEPSAPAATDETTDPPTGEASAVAGSGTGPAPGSGTKPAATAGSRGATAAATAATAKPTSPSSIAVAMYPMADVRDAEACRLVAGEDGALTFEAVTNPAMSCPDAFAWKVMVEAVRDEFWRHWASDQYTWPQADWPPDEAAADATGPYPLCGAAGADPERCCDPSRLDNPGYEDPRYPAKHCPYFPDDHDDVPGFELPQPQARAPAVAQHDPFAGSVSGPVSEPGRIIRQEMSELVYRNRPFWAYTFDNALYHQEGLAAAYAAAEANLTQDAPYHGTYGPGTLTRIDYPVDAVMIKSNWLNEERARALGIVDDADHPYITMDIRSPVTDNNGTTFIEGKHYLVALHISTKDIPNWTWATFEHVNNPGRCDYTGCNDSFGYRSPDAVAPHLADNYTAPHTQDDQLVDNALIIDPGGLYPGGRISPALAALFAATGIGTRAREQPWPSAADRGWLSYRLKGSQVGFTDATGRATFLGNSVTEGGFVGSSSCVSCHARAAVGPSGTAVLGIFEPRLSEVGYPQSSFGIPDPDWFVTNSSSAHFLDLIGLQSDFVWGILFASPLSE
jgi:hypothetical protein